MSEWQSMESAPKDGTVILLSNRVGVWAGKYHNPYASGFVPENPWQSMMLNHEHMGVYPAVPVRWMPLPDATTGYR